MKCVSKWMYVHTLANDWHRCVALCNFNYGTPPSSPSLQVLMFMHSLRLCFTMLQCVAICCNVFQCCVVYCSMSNYFAAWQYVVIWCCVTIMVSMRIQMRLVLGHCIFKFRMPVFCSHSVLQRADMCCDGKRLKTLDINDACHCLGYWGYLSCGTQWWHERHKRGSPRKYKSGTQSNTKRPADARTFCRTLRTVRIRRLPVLGSPHQVVAEWNGGSGEQLGTKRIKTYCTYYSRLQTHYILFQLQRVAMSAPCSQRYSRRPCCCKLTNACGMKIL